MSDESPLPSLKEVPIGLPVGLVLTSPFMALMAVGSLGAVQTVAVVHPAGSRHR